MQEKNSRLVLIIMKNLNFLVLCFVSIVISYSLSGIIAEGSALDFLSKVHSLALAPWKLLFIVISLYISLLFLMGLENLNNIQIGIRLVIEMVLVFLIIYCIGFTYTGIILLLLAVSIDFLPKSKWRIPFIILLCIVYLFFEYIIISLSSSIIPFSAYLEYFQNDARLVLQALINLMSSLNLLLFLVYMIFVVRSEYNEKEYILTLNNKLNETNLELQEANTQLAAYSKEIVKMTETRERNRLAREIHDTLGHTLTGIITGLEACIALIDVAPEATKIQLKSIMEVASQGMTDVRRSVNALRPDRLEKFDLREAIIKTIVQTENTTQAKITYEITPSLDNLSIEEEDTIFRIVQESMTNSIRHGRADRIKVTIKVHGDYLHIIIKDNGIGCKDVKKGFSAADIKGLFMYRIY